MYLKPGEDPTYVSCSYRTAKLGLDRLQKLRALRGMLPHGSSTVLPHLGRLVSLMKLKGQHQVELKFVSRT